MKKMNLEATRKKKKKRKEREKILYTLFLNGCQLQLLVLKLV